MIEVIKGNIFTSKCQVIVNTVNCVGIMGAGIALECRLRYPEMYDRYVELCDQKKIDVGMLWLYKSDYKWILNFPTKKHWKNPSKVEYLQVGLKKFADMYKSRKIDSVAFPMLGADKGGIPENESMDVMMTYLDDLPIKIEIYQYDVKAKDDLYEKTKEWFLSQDVASISLALDMRKNSIEKLLIAMSDESIVQINQLFRVNGIGIKALEKVFLASRLPQNS